MEEMRLVKLEKPEAAVHLAKLRAQEILTKNSDPFKHLSDFERLWIETDYCRELQDYGTLGDDVYVAECVGQIRAGNSGMGEAKIGASGWFCISCGHIDKCPRGDKMDTCEQVAIETAGHAQRRQRSIEEKRRIVEETLAAGASVARVARRHAVNANQVFYWRQKYREGRLGKVSSSNLLPVTISEIPTNKSGQVRGVAPRCTSGTMEIQVAKGQLRVMGNVEAEAGRKP